MQLVLTAGDKDHTIEHDLNFQTNRYESKHNIVRAPLSESPKPLYELLTRSLLPDVQEPQARSHGQTKGVWPCPR
jgi:hypothetical protein